MYGVLIQVKDIHVSLFSVSCWIPPPSRESVFNVVWRTKVPKTVRFFIRQVLLGRLTLLIGLLGGRLCFLGFLLHALSEGGGRR